MAIDQTDGRKSGGKHKAARGSREAMVKQTRILERLAHRHAGTRSQRISCSFESTETDQNELVPGCRAAPPRATLTAFHC